ncbi:MAG TPA: protein phosphatase 2C domain-containing protein [Polyangiaceae bacterium]|nr:protein phosphatase 2C domain-containing protein [Polyangiaceae bacterium]
MVLGSSAGVVVDHAAVSDPGRDPEKQINEDAVAVAETPFGVTVVVCDGMGGHIGGERASRAAVARIVDVLGSSGGPVSRALQAAFEQAHAEVYALGGDLPVDQRPGSTAVVLTLAGREALIAHVGDSRAYRLRGGALERLTRDHSVVAALIAAGAIRPENADRHPDANRITRALGISPELEPELSAPLFVNPGDVFALCTDGLSDLVSDAEIAEVLASAESPEVSCKKLVDLANARGGHDNVTIAVARVLEVSDKRPRETVEMGGQDQTVVEPPAFTVMMTRHAGQRATVADQVARDTSPTLVDGSELLAAVRDRPPRVEFDAPSGRPSLPPPRLTGGRTLFIVSAVLCAVILGAIALWWLFR